VILSVVDAEVHNTDNLNRRQTNKITQTQ
jgi:hypothetical protein